MRLHFTTSELHVLEQALRVASAQYRGDAKTLAGCAKAEPADIQIAGFEKLVRQFELQAKRAEELAERIAKFMEEAP